MSMHDLPNGLEDCLVHLKDGETMEQVLARYPTQRAELTPLLAFAIQLNESAPALADDTQRRIEMQLRGALRARELKPTRRYTVGVWALRFALVLITVLIIGMVGFVETARAEPGGFLFTIRLLLNERRVQFAPNAHAALVARLIWMASRSPRFKR